ncbi:unnamed protein product [Merluccius merluccius]
MRGPLQCVLWDVKDTLLKVRMSVGQQYCKEAHRAGLDLKPSEVDVAFRQTYQHCSRHYPNYGITQGMDGQAWWMKVVRDTFSRCKVQDPTLLNTMALNLYNDFCNPENWELGWELGLYRISTKEGKRRGTAALRNGCVLCPATRW